MRPFLTRKIQRGPRFVSRGIRRLKEKGQSPNPRIEAANCSLHLFPGGLEKTQGVILGSFHITNAQCKTKFGDELVSHPTNP